jgi:hypothetical protein
MNRYRKVCVLAAVLVAGVSQADNWAIGQFGGAIADNTTVNYDLVVTGTGLIVTSVDTAVLAQMTHTFVGDLRVTLTHVDSGTSVHLFHFVGTGAFGDSSDLGNAGNYLFQMGATQSIDEIAATLDGATTIPDGTYRPAGQANFNATTNGANSVNSDYSVFNGLALGATWRVTVQDKAGGDTGAFDHWELHGTGDPVPEPATFAALGLGALALLHRRRRAA